MLKRKLTSFKAVLVILQKTGLMHLVECGSLVVLMTTSELVEWIVVSGATNIIISQLGLRLACNFVNVEVILTLSHLLVLPYLLLRGEVLVSFVVQSTRKLLVYQVLLINTITWSLSAD